MTYRFSFRRPRSLWPIWRTLKVTGHRYEPAQDKVVLFFPDGGIREISRWRECEVRLGADWVLAVQKAMEAQAGQAVPVNVGG